MEDIMDGLPTQSGSTDHLERVIRDSKSKEDRDFEQATEEVLEHLNSPLKTDAHRKALDQNKHQEIQTTKLKELPSHLKYVFLGGDRRYPTIISNNVTEKQEEILLEVLTEYKKALDWNMHNLMGISPTLCMYKIKMEEKCKPVVQPQKCLNPTMKEIVKKEVLKILEAWMIYPISDKKE